MLEAKGKIESFGIATRKDGSEISGIRGGEHDGEKWTMYKYKIGNKYYSGFKSLKECEIELGDFVIVAYEESPNPNNASKPYKNLKNLTKGISEEEVTESDKQYNVKKVGDTPSTPNVDFHEALQERITRGMVFNKTIDWIISERALIGKGFTLDDNFDKIYDHLLKKAKEKSK